MRPPSPTALRFGTTSAVGFIRVGDANEFRKLEGRSNSITAVRGVMGIYKVSGKLVTVVYGSSIKTAQLGILPAEMLAHMLLRDMEFQRRETERNTLGE